MSHTHIHPHTPTHPQSWWAFQIPPYLSLLTSLAWFTTLWALLITWLAQHRPHYTSESATQTVAYISDVAAEGALKPVFVVGCCLTGVGFGVCLAAERWERGEGRLLPNMRTREKVMASLAIFWAFVGGLGLILLSIFDTRRFPSLHRVFLLVFVLGTALSAIFTIIEYRWLNKDYGARFSRLRNSYLFKAIFATILIVLAIAFGATLTDDSKQNQAACIEWTISFLFTFYILCFFFDLRGSRRGERGQVVVRMGRTNGDGNVNGGTGMMMVENADVDVGRRAVVNGV